MDAVLVDTDVVSYLLKHDTRADPFHAMLTNRVWTVSFMTVAELERWALDRNWGAKTIARLEKHLERFLVHPFYRPLCKAWARVMHERRKVGKPMGVADAWIAATALFHSIPLVTNNVTDFLGIDGLTLLTTNG
jgi:predicted nucleic acid-binding protein